MTNEEWKASVLRRIDRLESADSAMQKEINEIKTSVSESKLIVANLEKMQAERFERLEEKLTTKLDAAEQKTDSLIASLRKFHNAFWIAAIGAAVVWVGNGGLTV